MPVIRENLKAMRNISGLSQAKVADALNVTRQTISSYETGRTEPDWETLKRLAELYNADMHDVLYGGNRLQRKIKLLHRGAGIISAILLLSLLIHSALLLVMNTFFVVGDGTAVTSENYQFIENRFALRDAAGIVARAGTGAFSLGCVVLLYPLIAIENPYFLRKRIAWILGLMSAEFAVTVPFMLSDKIYGKGDYLLPILNSLPCIALLFLASIVAAIVRKVRAK